MMRRGFRYEETESNVENVSLVRHLIAGMQVTTESGPFKTIQSAWKTLKLNRELGARGLAAGQIRAQSVSAQRAAVPENITSPRG